MNGLPASMGMSAFYPGAPAGNFMMGTAAPTVMNGIGPISLPPSSPKIAAATTQQLHQLLPTPTGGTSEVPTGAGGRNSRPSSTASSTEPPSTKMPRLATEVEERNGSITADLGGDEGVAAAETPGPDDDAASYQSGSEDPSAAIVQQPV